MTPILIVATMLFSCGEDEATDTTSEIDITLYTGNYELTANHITGIHPHHDSIGNFLYYGIDTFNMAPMILDISQLNNSDSLRIEGIITSENVSSCCSREVFGVLENDSIKLVRELGNSIRNDYVRGYIILDSDSIIVNYRWDRSDTWSTDALPIYGLVKGSDPI